MNVNTPGSAAELAAALQLSRRRVHRAVIARVWELYDGGVTPAEIAAHTGYPAQLVALVLRGGSPKGVPK